MEDLQSGWGSPLSKYPEDQSGSEEESDGAGRRGLVRQCVWGATAGLLVVLLCLPFLWLCLPLVNNSMIIRNSDHAAPRKAHPFFREKVLVSRRTTSAPPSTSIAPVELQVPPTLVPTTAAPAMSTTELLLQDHGGHDGCGPTEELFGGLCYKTCSLLTKGEDPIRTSPWTCCKSHPCALNQKGSIGSRVACAGYDVAGDGSCPHKPGRCLEDEELLLGVCYKKCSLLTDQEFPHRVAPATCCKESGLGCLDFRKDYTSKDFAVGGGEEAASACGETGELWLGMCYKKCRLLTGNEYPHRVAAATCCKAQSRLPHKGQDGVWHLGCLDFRQDKTRSDFNVQVGQEEHEAHLPLLHPTEELAI